MVTTVLKLRMEALAQHLREAQDPSIWLGSLQLSPMPDKNLWFKAVEAIQREADSLLADLEADLESPTDDAEKLWKDYFRIYERSHEIFRESLELLGGLALRDRIHEEYACRFADELISECAEFVGKPTSFAIPATEDALSSTLRRVARISFPDWHLWALPLVAHEYGQVVVRETASFDRFVDELASQASKPVLDENYNDLKSALPAIANSGLRRIAHDQIAQAELEPRTAADKMESLALMLRADEADIGERAQKAARSIKASLDSATNQARVLVADVFATYTAGPAYACAALMLRLNPNSPPVPGRPTDEERAETILAVLAQMDAATPNPPPPFAKVGQSLQSSWTLLLDGSGRHDPPGQVHLDAAHALSMIKKRMLRDQAEFTKADWIEAESLGNAWWIKINAGQKPDVSANVLPNIDHLRLRDVLNAAWQCRLLVIEQAQPEDASNATDKVTDAARQLCDRILASRQALLAPAEFGGRAPRPGEASAG